MERLTKRIGGEAICRECTGPCGTCDGTMCFSIGPMVDRLAAYEDAMPLERAQELAKAEKDGRLVMLPEGTESMMMAGFVAEGNEMLHPVMETKGNPEYIPAILSLMVDSVSTANKISYKSLLSALIENPPVVSSTLKEDAAALKKREMQTMRLIDAEPIIKNLSAMKTQLGYDAIDIDGMIKALRDAEKVEVATPTNAPLTMEELREMNGEPVWYKSLIEKHGEYFILRVINGIYFAQGGGSDKCAVSAATYGSRWIAYRRKPEEGPNATA